MLKELRVTKSKMHNIKEQLTLKKNDSKVLSDSEKLDIIMLQNELLLNMLGFKID
jgi:hypothetical protein